MKGILKVDSPAMLAAMEAAILVGHMTREGREDDHVTLWQMNKWIEIEGEKLWSKQMISMN